MLERYRWLFTAFVVLAVAAPHTARPQVATEHPSDEGGFKPGQVYQTGDVDDVNLFNGNLTLTIPLGIRYPVGPGLSYQFKLIYSTASWGTAPIENPIPGEPDLTLSLPDGYNAGFGWNLGFGYLTNPSTGSNRYNPELTLYFDPNGGQHSFYPTLHPNDGDQRSDYGYTRDSTYLRLRANPAAEPFGTRYLELPDGTVHVFDPQGRIREIRNQFTNVTGNPATSTNNFVKFAWSQSDTLWTISDSQGRSHSVHFAQSGVTNVITQVDLQNPDERESGPAVYTFEYHSGGPQTIRQPFPANDRKNPDVTVDLLVGVQQPDGSRWIPGNYILDARHSTADPDFVLDGYNLSSGFFLQTLTTPLGATLRWGYTLYRYPTHVNRPLFFNSAGVGSKTVTGNNLPGAIHWTYAPKTQFSDRENEFYNVVTDPLGHSMKHYFNVSEPVETFGLPYTPYDSVATPVGDKFLSREVFRAGSANKLRSHYVQFEWESGRTRDRNRILKAERTVFDDDPEVPVPGAPGRVLDVDRSLPDGRGHYRLQATDGSTGPRREVRIEFSIGTPSPLSRWVLNTFSEVKRTQSGRSFRELHCFDARGFLQRRRWLKDTSLNPMPGDHDLIRVFVPDAAFFIEFEQLHGGDLHTVPATSSCGDALGGWERQIFHAYERGVRRSSQTTGANFASLDLQIGRAGLPISSKDPSRIETKTTYDSMGRPVIIRTGDDGPLHINYRPNDRPAEVVSQRFRDQMATEMSHERVFFDALGRPFRSLRQRDGDDVFDETRTGYDNAGNVMFRSEAARQAEPDDNFGTHYRSFDPFGRPGEIEAADGSKTTFEYRGRRWVRTTTKVGTLQDGQGNTTQQTVLKVETYDHFGRLDGVQEEIGTVANYSYDAMDHLVGVSLSGPGGGATTGSFITQDREFGYDGRGFLRWEKHPEKQTNAFTPWDAWSGYPQDSHVDYLNYNTLGLAGLRVDGDNHVRFLYDLAGRPTDVILERDASGTLMPQRRLKWFDYGDSANPGNRNLGKVTAARRWNYLRAGGRQFAYVSRYDYVYGGRNGRLSKRDTSATFDEWGQLPQQPETPSDETFTQGWTWDEAGRPVSVSYPQCTFAPCNGIRTTSFADVPLDHPYHRDIEAIVGAGLTAGCGLNQFCPEDTLTRAQIAAFLIYGLKGITYRPPPCSGQIFADVTCSHWAASYIHDMWNRGLTAGCATNPARFCPEQPVTRAEVATFLLKVRHGANYQPPNCQSSGFTDVVCGSNQWFATWVAQARVEGLIEGRLVRGADGCGGSASAFCPGSLPTRGEVAGMLRRGFNVALPPNDASARVVRNVYEDGFLTEVSPFAGIKYHPNGLAKSINYVNGDSWLQEIASHRMPRPAVIRLNFGDTSRGLYYSYDGVGNVIRVQTGPEASSPAEKYRYDSSSRLVRGTLSDGVYQQFTYDGFGSIQSIASGNTQFNRNTPTDSFTNRLSTAGGYADYDRSGNQKRFIATTYEYDGLNMLSRVAGAEDWQHVYDADDERIVSIRFSPNGARFYRFTLRDLDGKVLRTWETPEWNWTKPVTDHVYRGSRLLATAWMANGEGNKWNFPDHLGTPRIIRQVSNGAGVEHHYLPFGEELTSSSSDGERMKFTGHERDGLTTSGVGDDLDYMHARSYNPLVGRFTSADRGAFRLGLPQSFNRYAYVRNNPLRLVDRNGAQDEDAAMEALKGTATMGASTIALGGAVGGAMTMTTTGSASVYALAASAGGDAGLALGGAALSTPTLVVGAGVAGYGLGTGFDRFATAATGDDLAAERVAFGLAGFALTELWRLERSSGPLDDIVTTIVTACTQAGECSQEITDYDESKKLGERNLGPRNRIFFDQELMEGFLEGSLCIEGICVSRQ